MRIIILLSFMLMKVANASESNSSPNKTDFPSSSQETEVYCFDSGFEEVVEFLFQRGTPDKNELRAAIRSLDPRLRKFLDVFITKKKESMKVIEVDTKTFRLLPVLIQKCLLYRNV